MTGQVLSRVRNPYPVPARLERRRLHRVRVVIALAWRAYLRNVDHHLETVGKVAIAIALAAAALDILAASSRGWTQ